MTTRKIIIGVTGTHASGKDTVASYICEKYKLKSYSTSDEIRYEATKLNLDHSRTKMFVLANQLRERFGAGELARRALNRIKEDMAVITSIRNVGEIEYLKKQTDFYLISVDGPIEIRYERAVKRERLGDGKTLEDFRIGEEREMYASELGQQLIPCMKMADYFVINDGTIEKLDIRTEEVMKAIMLQIASKRSQ